MRIRQTKWIIGIALILFGVGIIAATTLSKSTRYYVTVAELMSNPSKHVETDLKVAGKVSDGSIQKQEERMQWRFRIETEEKHVWVNYRGAIPDAFKDGAEVVVTGRFESTHELSAINILAKCASKYEEKLEES